MWYLDELKINALYFFSTILLLLPISYWMSSFRSAGVHVFVVSFLFSAGWNAASARMAELHYPQLPARMVQAGFFKLWECFPFKQT